VGDGANVIGYVRVSTDEQSDSGLGLRAQRAAIRAEAARHGWTLVEIFEDVASGKSLRRRPGLEAAFAAVASGEADGLIVSKLDRLSRSVRDFAEILARFQRNGWALVVMDLGLDTSTIMGAAMAQMVSVFSGLERKRIAERTREALAVKKASGVRLGRPPTVPQAVVRRIQRQRARGESLRAIAESLNRDKVATAQGGAMWYAATVRSILARST
jgi:DNA invertase Pin-like site-specific DNA recombinase